MPSVKLKVSISGTRNGQDWPPKGEVIDLPQDEADSLIAAGLAESPDTPDEPPVEVVGPKVEAATAPDSEVETAAETTTPARGRRAAAKKTAAPAPE